MTGDVPGPVKAVEAESNQADPVVRTHCELGRPGCAYGELLEGSGEGGDLLRHRVGPRAGTPMTGPDNRLKLDEVLIDVDDFNRDLTGQVKIVHELPPSPNRPLVRPGRSAWHGVGQRHTAPASEALLTRPLPPLSLDQRSTSLSTTKDECRRLTTPAASAP
jgi:hypothetical protein